MGKLYISYGSNLCKRQMRQRCPTARPLGRFMLAQAKLVFRSVADLEFDKNAETPCGLWNVEDSDVRALDRYEGIHAGVYFKSEEIVLNYQGRKRRALVYLMNSQAIFPPSQAYADTIRRGYRDFGLDESYLNAAIAASYTEKAPDETVLARRSRQIGDRVHDALVSRPQQPPPTETNDEVQGQEVGGGTEDQPSVL